MISMKAWAEYQKKQESIRASIRAMERWQAMLDEARAYRRKP